MQNEGAAIYKFHDPYLSILNPFKMLFLQKHLELIIFSEALDTSAYNSSSGFY